MKYNLAEKGIRHIAIIMDGNGRWAKGKAMLRTAGHEKGVESIREIVRHSGEIGLDYLSLFAFSNENWKRPKTEVDFIMRLLSTFCEKEVKNLKEANCRVRFIGSRENMPKKQLAAMDKMEAELSEMTGLKLLIFVNYGGRQDLIHAVKAVAEQGYSAEEIDEELISSNLMTAGIPDPDILIRTGGELRISNFMLWQISYSELYFTDCYWPDFKSDSLDAAIMEFGRRTRRFGGLV